jgi:predicted enzyme related to lactoylglutathione lyase
MAPRLFRIILQVSDLEKAAAFYGKLLDDPGRTIPHAFRHYIDCGPVILALVDPSGDDEELTPSADNIYFAVDDLEAIHARAKELNCLSPENVHEVPAGEIVKRPWGERSFYAVDPWGNMLCFVDEKTLFTGK